MNKSKIEKNLDTYGPFATTEAVLMEAVRKGANRQQMHEVLRELSMKAWEQLQEDKANPLSMFIKQDVSINKFIPKEKLRALLDPKKHLGLAPQRCLKFLKKIDHELFE